MGLMLCIEPTTRQTPILSHPAQLFKIFIVSKILNILCWNRELFSTILHLPLVHVVQLFNWFQFFNVKYYVFLLFLIHKMNFFHFFLECFSSYKCRIFFSLNSCKVKFGVGTFWVERCGSRNYKNLDLCCTSELLACLPCTNLHKNNNKIIIKNHDYTLIFVI